ncbi:hypothetical protein HGP28_18795 [Vibrio sp. SM6]|uniref:DUF2721 domain-containing protein n=1 Tax=Vibrio agarilyticus TaxID=2726741 RepID=A0A7X8TU11_9VIBR|nr:hypothetical protein [Vibrio agarilyticus]NLS14907.1 hypothetical protein [Vibrio agarilyticus]
MEDIKQLITSPAFWFASVVIAFLMSLLAGFAKDWTEKLWAGMSNKRRFKLEQKEHDIAQKVEQLKSNSLLLYTYQTNIIFQKIRQILYYLVSYFCMFLGFHNYLNGSTTVAISFAVISVLTIAIPVRWVTKDLDKLRIIVNKVLADDDFHFRG